MAEAAVPIMIGGSLLGSYGAYQEGEAKGEAHDYNAQVARENAQLALEQGAEEERRVRVQGRKVVGEMRASYGASGVSSTSGSAVDALADSAAMAEMDALTVRRNAEIKSYQFNQQAGMEDRAARASRTGGKISAASTLLGGIGGAVIGRGR